MPDRTIVRKTLRDLRWRIVGWGLGLAALAALLVLLFPVIGAQFEGVEVENFGFGDIDDLSNPRQFLQVEFFTWSPVLMTVFSIMVGGDQATFDLVKPLLDAMGNPERVVRIGDSGAGQLCKVCNQMVIGGTLAVVSEALVLARKAGVDPVKVREALLGGFAASRVLEVHGERILTGNYTPGFRAALYAKDYRIASATLAEHQVPAPVTAVVQQLVDALIASGRGEDDYSALATVLFDRAGL